MARFPRMPRRVLAALPVSLLALLLAISTASAGIGWCRVDPVVRLNGVKVQIMVSIPDQYQYAVTGPVQVKIVTPGDVSEHLLMADGGYNGFGEEVTFKDAGRMGSDGSFRMSIQVKVPIDVKSAGGHGLVPVQVTVIPENGATKVFTGNQHATAGSLIIGDVN